MSWLPTFRCHRLVLVGKLAIPYRRFEMTYLFHFSGVKHSNTLENSRYDIPKRRQGFTILRCLKSKKNAN
jgi:hypothetical protein